MTKILHKLDERYDDLLRRLKKQPQDLQFRVRGNRMGNRIPVVAPFDVGINREWYEAHKDLPKSWVLMGDWFEWGNPEGYPGPSAPQTVDVGAGGDGEVLDGEAGMNNDESRQDRDEEVISNGNDDLLG